MCVVALCKGLKVANVSGENAVQERRCFIITPIGNENSDTYRKAKGVIESVIKPILQERGFEDIKPSYEINISGMINTQIINRIIEDDLVIANLTGNNPNVMYELCLRHVVAKPIIHICENGTILPFDIKDNRTIFYTNDMLGVEELKAAMMKYIDEIVYDEEYVDNPIYTAYRFGRLLKETQGTETNEILKILVDISGKLSEMEIIKQEPAIWGLNRYKGINFIGDSIYTNDQFREDVKKIDKNKVKNLLSRHGKMKIHEMAKELNISSKTLVRAGQIIGLNIQVAQEIVTEENKNKILNYILEN